jgi:F-type H+-transporting ATPase subunit b
VRQANHLSRVAGVRFLLCGTLCLVLSILLITSAPAFSQTGDASGQTGVSTEKSAEGQSSSEGGTAQFRHSGSVHLLARITGLSEDGAYWLAVFINFAIVVWVIAWLWKKNVPAAFRNRTAAIQKLIEEARRASEDADRRLADIETRLSRLDQEVAHMREISEKEAATEDERTKAAAAEDAQRVIQSAEQEIAASAKAARRELTAYAADLAVSLAAKQIRVDAPADQALVRRFAQQLSNGSSGKKS